MVIHKAVAEITIESVVEAIRHWFGHHRFDATLPVLWDCRDQFIHASVADLATIHEHLLEHRHHQRQRQRDGRGAVLVSNMTSAAALSVLEENSYLMPDIRVFHDPADAHTWLGVRPQDLEDAASSGDAPSASA
jgi:hypothetical protein